MPIPIQSRPGSALMFRLAAGNPLDVSRIDNPDLHLGRGQRPRHRLPEYARALHHHPRQGPAGQPADQQTRLRAIRTVLPRLRCHVTAVVFDPYRAGQTPLVHVDARRPRHRGPHRLKARRPRLDHVQVIDGQRFSVHGIDAIACHRVPSWMAEAGGPTRCRKHPRGGVRSAARPRFSAGTVRGSMPGAAASVWTTGKGPSCPEKSCDDCSRFHLLRMPDARADRHELILRWLQAAHVS